MNSPYIFYAAISAAAVLMSSCSFLPQGAVLGGRMSENLPITIDAEKEEPSVKSIAQKSEYSLFFKKSGLMPAKLEPETGCYIGAYVLSNSHIDYDMKRFDYLTKKNHALSSCRIRLDERVPKKWINEVVGDGKTPYIAIYPPNDYLMFDEENLEKIANSFSDLSFSFFVDFYPLPQSYTKNSALYADFYKKARQLFKEKVPGAVFVITADSKNVYDFDLYYPGNEYVDWVGISVYHTIYTDGEPNLRNYMKDLNYFYAMYQYEKPIIVSSLAFSSHSTTNATYAPGESAKRLTEFYSKIKKDYGRIKGVIYMDFNGAENAPKAAERDNFSVTQSDVMLDAYRRAVSDKYFLSETSANVGQTQAEGLFRSFFGVMEQGNIKYIPRNAIENYVNTEGLPLKIIDSEIYYSIEELAKKGGITIETDDENKRIIIGLKNGGG